MKNNEHNKEHIKEQLHQYNVPLVSESDIDMTIQKGEKMMGRMVQPKTPFVSLIINQVKYISPFLWVTQIAVIIIMLLLSINLTEPYIQLPKILFSITPLLAFFAVLVLTKSMIYGMIELEYVSKNSPTKILLSRLFIIGCINIITITIIVAFATMQYSIPFTYAMLYGIVPFNVVIGLNLLVFHIFKIRSSSITIGVSLGLVVLMKLITELSFFAVISQTMWIMLFIVTTAFLLIELYYFISAMTNKEAIYQWN